jgi:cytochrome c2
MKKALKILAYLLGLILLVIGGAATYIQVRGVPKYKVAIPAELQKLSVPKDSNLVAEGKRFSTLLCQNCHYSNETKKLTGIRMYDVPKAFGIIYSRNITQDPVKGIGEWTDGELYYFLRTGIHAKTGQYIPPYMPKFPLLSEQDMYAIIAWLRSDDPMLAPDRYELPEIKPSFLIKALANTVMKPIALPEKAIFAPDTLDKVALGRYIANNLIGCYGCHSADLTKINALEPEKTPGFYGGGTAMLDEKGEKEIFTANITMDKETGIGNWTEEQFIAAVRFCQKPGGGSLRYPMLPHTALSDQEVKAMWAYLQTIPKINNKVNRSN